MSGKLPNTNISVSLVSQTIGDSKFGITELVTSPAVNRWGIFTPDREEWRRFFGVSPTAPYPLGIFRGYEHDWQCYALEDIADKTTHSSNVLCNIIIKKFPDNSVSHNVMQNWSVYFSRLNDFYKGGGVIVPNYNNQNFASGDFMVVVDKTTPPDGGAPIQAGDTVYLKIQKNGDPVTNGWDNRQSFLPTAGSDASSTWWIKPFTIPASPFSNTIGFGSNTSFYAWNQSPDNRRVAANIEVINNTEYVKDLSVDIKWLLNDTSIINQQTILIQATGSVIHPDGSISPGVGSGYTEGAASGVMTVGSSITPYVKFSYTIAGAIMNTDWVPYTPIIVTVNPPSR